MVYAVIKSVVRFALCIAFNLHYEGRENIPEDTPVIYASNHRTNADPPLVGCATPGHHAFMAKEELFENKFFGNIIRRLGAFPVSRGKGDTGVIDKSVDALNQGRSLFIFPEGTRSKDGKVHKGHSGAALIAACSGKPIVPVGVVFGEKLKFRTKVTIKYGNPINPADYCDICSNPNPRQLVRLKNRYMTDIKNLVEGEQEEINE